MEAITYPGIACPLAQCGWWSRASGLFPLSHQDFATLLGSKFRALAEPQDLIRVGEGVWVHLRLYES